MIINGRQYREVRCQNCKNYIVYEDDAIGRLAHKCPKCGYLNEIVLKMLKTKANIEKMMKYLVNPKGGEN